MTENEQMLDWLDRLRDGVANHNAAAESTCRWAMGSSNAPHVHVAGEQPRKEDE